MGRGAEAMTARAREQLAPFTKERFEEIKARADSLGYKVIGKWRPGLKPFGFRI